MYLSVRKLSVVICILLVMAGFFCSSYAGLVDIDPVRPSVGPYSNGPRLESQKMEIDIEKSSTPVLLPKSSINPNGPKTPSVNLGFYGVDGEPREFLLRKPPDTHIAVGSGANADGRVIMVTNGGLGIWNKNGSTVASITTLENFLGLAAGEPYDPKVIYDQSSIATAEKTSHN